MDWQRDGGSWPNATASRFVDSRPHRWHVQDAGEGPTVLLLHGAFGATQSWRGLFPLLEQRFHVVAIDLPGQGFSTCHARSRLSVRCLAEDIARLCDHEGWNIDLMVGHSAGAVLALELCAHLSPAGVVALNAALGKFDGIAGWLFPLMARALALNPFAAPLLARMPNSETRVRDLLSSTGSRYDEEMLAHYRQLAGDRAHVSGTIAMMAAWNIDTVLGKLGTIDTPTLLLAGEKDGTVPPRVSEDAASSLPQAVFEVLPGLGHLMHEEDPESIARRIDKFAQEIGVLDYEASAEKSL